MRREFFCLSSSLIAAGNNFCFFAINWSLFRLSISSDWLQVAINWQSCTTTYLSGANTSMTGQSVRAPSDDDDGDDDDGDDDDMTTARYSITSPKNNHKVALIT